MLVPLGLIVGIFLKVCQAAQISANTSEELIENASMNVVENGALVGEPFRFAELDDSLQMKILSFLKYPHYNMAAVNKNFRDFFENVFPYNRVVAQQFGIPELGSSKFPRELRFFQELDYIPKGLTKFHILHNQLFNFGTDFGNNAKYIALHIYNEYKNLTPEYKTSSKRSNLFAELVPNVIDTFIKSGAYDFLAKMLKENPDDFAKGIYGFDIDAARELLKIVIGDVESMRNLIKMSMKIGNTRKCTFIFALLMYFPHEEYIHLLDVDCEHRDFFMLTFHCLFLLIPVRDEVREEVGERAMSIYKLIFGDNPDNERFMKLWNIRFGGELNLEDYETTDIVIVGSYLLSASSGNRKELVKNLVKNHKNRVIEIIKEMSTSVWSELFYDVFVCLPEEDKLALLNHDDKFFWHVLFDSAFIYEIIENADESYQLCLKSNPDLVNRGAPEFIYLNTDCKIDELMTMASFVDYEALKIFMTLAVDKLFLFDPDIEEILVSPRERIAAEIMNMLTGTVQLKIDPANVGSYAITIRMANPNTGNRIYKPRGLDKINLEILTKFNSNDQFSNLSQTFETSIAQEISLLKDDVDYGEIREALHYVLDVYKVELRGLAGIKNEELWRELAKERPEEVRIIREAISALLAEECTEPANIEDN